MERAKVQGGSNFMLQLKACWFPFSSVFALCGCGEKTLTAGQWRGMIDTKGEALWLPWEYALQTSNYREHDWPKAWSSCSEIYPSICTEVTLARWQEYLGRPVPKKRRTPLTDDWPPPHESLTALPNLSFLCPWAFFFYVDLGICSSFFVFWFFVIVSDKKIANFGCLFLWLRLLHIVFFKIALCYLRRYRWREASW